MAATTDELEQAIAPLCAAAGLDLVDVELHQRTLQVTVEREDGLDLETVADIARTISTMLDERSDLAPAAPFELEVSSPGVERRLRRPAHYERVLGAEVALRTVPGTEGERRIEGLLKVADADGVLLVLKDGAERRLSYNEIERAHTIFDWRAALRGAAPEEPEDADAGEDDGASATAAGGTRSRSGQGGHTRERESR